MVMPVPAIAVVAPVPRETLQEMSDRIAGLWRVPTTTLSNLWHSESSGSTTVTNIGGDRGVVQINKYAHPEVSDAQAFDPDFALNFAAHSIASSTEDQFVVCNCYAFLKTKIRGLPRMEDITPNSTPHAGAVAVFLYRDKKTGLATKHVAYVESIGSAGFEVAEANFSACLLDSRHISWNDPRLQGFWSSPN
jgi:hypothetical protein